jgi:hypothetical protein
MEPKIENNFKLLFAIKQIFSNKGRGHWF